MQKILYTNYFKIPNEIFKLDIQGVERMIELFRDKLTPELAYIKNFSLSRLMTTFEKGYALLEGDKVDLSGFKQKAIEAS
ncbi:MAG: hypothetical protein DSY60_01110 [Persephonella sp.]|nr:MAG: hypothetical protein DSY60_01110 [Persephonella sp.]